MIRATLLVAAAAVVFTGTGTARAQSTTSFTGIARAQSTTSNTRRHYRASRALQTARRAPARLTRAIRAGVVRLRLRSASRLRAMGRGLGGGLRKIRAGYQRRVPRNVRRGAAVVVGTAAVVGAGVLLVKNATPSEQLLMGYFSVPVALTALIGGGGTSRRGR